MQPVTDCNGIPYPVYTIGKVTDCASVDGARPEGSVSVLKIEISGEKARLPVAGQFFMVR